MLDLGELHRGMQEFETRPTAPARPSISRA
jgi:hypothetical protein